MNRDGPDMDQAVAGLRQWHAGAGPAPCSTGSAGRNGWDGQGENDMADEAKFQDGAGSKRLVWDWPLRLFHWLLAVTIGLLWLTQWLGYEHLTEIPAVLDLDWMIIHMWLGYWMLGLIIFRILWGLVGPRHARFSRFFPSPGRIAAYLRGQSKAPGHNPLGALMVFLMLGLVALQTVSGLFASDSIFTYGPFADVEWVSPEVASLLNSIHHALFDYILIAIVIHIVAIVIYALFLKQHLLGPMIHGRKSAAIVPEAEAIASSEPLKAVIIIALSAAITYGLLSLAP